MNYPAAMPDDDLVAAVREKRMMLKKSRLDTKQRIRHAIATPERVATRLREEIQIHPLAAIGSAFAIGTAIGFAFFSRRSVIPTTILAVAFRRTGQIALNHAINVMSARLLTSAKSPPRDLPKEVRDIRPA